MFFFEGEEKMTGRERKKSILFVLVSRGGFFSYKIFSDGQEREKRDRFFFEVNFFGLCEWL